MKKYWKIITGAVLLFLGIGAFQYNEFQFEKNLKIIPDLGIIKVVGDTGEISSIRARTVDGLDSSALDTLVILGDEKYSDGIQNEEDFIKYIATPFYRVGRIILFIGGNHTQYAKSNRDYLLKLARSGKYPWFIYPNYYYAVITETRCLVFIDTALYDVKVPWADAIEVRDAQRDFIQRVPKLEQCKTKENDIFSHHGIYASDNSHGDRGNDLLREDYNKYIRGVYSNYTNGHSHVSSIEKCEYGTCHKTVGANSKSNTCVRGKNQTCWELPGAINVSEKFRLELF